MVTFCYGYATMRRKRTCTKKPTWSVSRGFHCRLDPNHQGACKPEKKRRY